MIKISSEGRAFVSPIGSQCDAIKKANWAYESAATDLECYVNDLLKFYRVFYLVFVAAAGSGETLNSS